MKHNFKNIEMFHVKHCHIIINNTISKTLKYFQSNPKPTHSFRFKICTLFNITTTPFQIRPHKPTCNHPPNITFAHHLLSFPSYTQFSSSHTPTPLPHSPQYSLSHIQIIIDKFHTQTHLVLFYPAIQSHLVTIFFPFSNSPQ